jgi:hypothetical protein
LESGKEKNPKTKIWKNLQYPYNKGERIIFFHKYFLLSTSTTFIFHQVPPFYLTGAEKTKTKKTLALQSKIKTLAKRFEDDEIDRAEHLVGLSLLMVSKK